MGREYEDSGITVGELIDRIKGFPRETPILFGQGHFTYSRVKDRSGVIQIEFHQGVGSEYELLPAYHEQKAQREAEEAEN